MSSEPFWKSWKTLRSNGLAPCSEKTYDGLCSPHPKEKEPILPITDELCLGYQFSARNVSDMLSSFPKGTAAGPSMLYPEHISNAIRWNNSQ